MNDELQERLSRYARSTTCFAVQPGVIDFPARCKKRPNHLEKHESWTGLSPTDSITWEDDEYHN